MRATSSADTRTRPAHPAKANSDGHFAARLDYDRTDPIPHLTVRVSLNLGNGPEWVAVGRIKSK